MADTIVIRADGSHEIGLGHIFRMLSLAQVLAAGGHQASFLSLLDERANAMVAKAGYGLAIVDSGDGECVARALAQSPPDLLLNDVLDTTTGYMKAVRPCAGRVANLDDRGPGGSLADIVVNSLPCTYRRRSADPEPRYLEGPEYLIIGSNFRELMGRSSRHAAVCRRVLVTFGGSDTHGQTVRVARVLRTVDGLDHIDIVVGPSFAHGTELARTTAADERVTVSCDVPNLAAIMDGHELAIVGGGITLFEAAAIGLPTLSIAWESFEAANARWCESQGFCCYLGRGHEIDDRSISAGVGELLTNRVLRQRMGERGPAAVDGRGLQRLAATLLEN